MIDSAFQFTSESLAQFIKNRFGLDESNVIMNNVIEADGSIPKVNQNKLVLSLINVLQETNKQYYSRNQTLNNGNYSDINPSERYNLDVLLTASFDDYSETLKFLNAGILFFQTYPALDSTSFSNLPEGLNRLEFDIEKISYRDMQGLWSAMGAKFQPSVIYKMRLITISSDDTRGFIVPVTKAKNHLMPS